MIRQIIQFEYKDEEAAQLNRLAHWLMSQFREMKPKQTAFMLNELFQGNWVYFRLLIEKVSQSHVELDEDEGRLFKRLVTYMLSQKGVGFSSDVGTLAAPLLRDLSNVEASGYPQRKSTY